MPGKNKVDSEPIDPLELLKLSINIGRNSLTQQTVADCEYIIRLYGVHRIERDGYLEGLILMELADRTLLDLLLASQSSPLS